MAAVSVTMAWIGMLPVRGGELGDVGAAFRLGKDDPVDIGPADQLEVVAVMLGAERIDAHPPLRAATGPAAAPGSRAHGLLGGRDAVLEVEDHGVGSLSSALAIFFSLSAGTNSQCAGARLAHAGFFSSSAERCIRAHQLIALVEAAMLPGDDAGVGPRLALADLDALAFAAQRVADEHRLGEDELVVAEVGDQRTERRVG